MSLKRQAFSGIRWTTTSALGRALLQVAQLAILARMLSPADFGMIAVVSSVMAFLGLFADAGISNAIIHHREISLDQRSSLYWLNALASGAIALLLALVAPLLAHIYEEPQLRHLFFIAGTTLAVSALGQQIRVTAQKELKFRSLALLELSSAALGFAASIALAYFGAGVLSIAVGGLLSAFCGTLLAWGTLSEGWRPRWRLNFGEMSRFLRFGRYMVGNNLVNSLGSQLDVLMGASLLGTHAAGLYSVPRSLTLHVQANINPIVTRVGLPVMAKAQHDKPLLKSIYLKTLRMTASVNFPIYVAIAVLAPEIVHFLLGRGWIDSVPLLRVFAIWGLLRSIGNPVGSLLFSTGHEKLSFYWNLALILVTALVVWIGSLFGPKGMAIVLTLHMGALILPMWYFLVRPACGANLFEYLAQLATPIVLSGCTAAAVYAALLDVSMPILRLLIGSIVGLTAYLALSLRFNVEWWDAMLELTSLRRR